VRVAVVSLVLLAITGSVFVASAAEPKKLPSTTYVLKSQGFRITVPETWQVVPPSVPAVKQIVARLKKQKKAQLATFYSDMISTAAGRKELGTFSFRAFKWPTLPSPVPTDVSVTIEKIPTRFKAADLPAIGASFARNVSSPGAKVETPQMLTLPAGRAAVITGTVPLTGTAKGLSTGFSLVLLLRPGRLYILSFRIDSRAAADANVFSSIANLFRFV
jgi:hypothetical protein